MCIYLKRLLGYTICLQIVNVIHGNKSLQFLQGIFLPIFTIMQKAFFACPANNSLYKNKKKHLGRGKEVKSCQWLWSVIKKKRTSSLIYQNSKIQYSCILALSNYVVCSSRKQVQLHFRIPVLTELLQLLSFDSNWIPMQCVRNTSTDLINEV